MMIHNFSCDGFKFNANFDSGNLAKVELAKVYSDAEKTAPDNVIDVEFNLWTKPDCAGTPFENSNRTWFFFSVTGGRPYQVAKINVMNLNKQAKLFSQGMHPVIRIGTAGKWERIKDKPAYFMTADSFILTFLHKNFEDTDIKVFYAFTFPYTYTEQQDQLDLYDSRYGRDTIQVETLVLEITGKRTRSSPVPPPRPESPPTMIETEKSTIDTDSVFIPSTLEFLRHNFEIKTTEELLQLPYSPIPSSVSPSPLPAAATDENTSEQIQQITDLVNNVKIELQKKEDKDLRDEIYYHRELITNSCEGRRIDLVTISSFHGITLKREERIKTLFPDMTTPRCHVFKDKKIIFVSSRVHPGETPASFVLNGFLQFILDRKNVASQTLRRMYVFKIVPFLNPDGVYNGLYRSDMLGHNLNRVYLSPIIETQPSIYAVRRLIRFYHFGFDKPETEEPSTSESSVVNQSIESNFTAYSGGDTCETHDDSFRATPNTVAPQFISSFDVEDDENATDLGLFSETMSRESSESSDQQSYTVFPPNTTTPPKSAPARHSPSASKLPTAIPRPTTATSARKSPPAPTQQKKTSPAATSTPTRVGSGAVNLKKSPTVKKAALGTSTASNNNNTTIAANSATANNLSRSQISPNQMTHHFRSHRNDFATLSPKNLNISLDFLTEVDEKGQKYIADENSGMFLYIDLHGHASKKGIFMYGNHLPTTQEAVECMLLPRLMSLNCQHFHFDACNFSEKNMYLKGKRDGLSKEGSGRVAIYKMIGLIKSYTLESNYNTGKYVNILPPKGKDGVSNKSTVVTPPKYTPAIFEEVGRALGPSILDLTGTNPNSRLLNSEFRNLQGLRNALRSDIERGGLKARAASKVLKPKTKRTEKVIQTDVSKENKGVNNFNHTTENACPLPGTSTKVATKASGSGTTPGVIRTGPVAPKLTRKNLGKFVKKENGATSTVSTMKKTKVLGEAAALKSDSRTNKDSNNPRKKIKVSPQRTETTTEPLITCFDETSIKYTTAVDTFDMCFTAAHTVTSTSFSSTSLPNFFTATPILHDTTCVPIKKLSASNMDLDDSLDAVPCCSYSLPPTTEPSLGLRSNSFAGSAAVSATKEFKLKFSKATGGGAKVKVAKVGADATKTKLKKKRTLRADSSLKRKKTRVKPVVC